MRHGLRLRVRHPVWEDFWDAFRPVAGPVLAPLVVAVFVTVLRLRVSRKTSDDELGGDAYLARLLPGLSRERSLPPSRRASWTDDASLDRARDHAQMAQHYLAVEIGTKRDARRDGA